MQSITSSREGLDGPSGSAGAEEVKGTSNKSIREPIYAPPSEDMLVKFSSTAGKAEVGELTFKLDPDFRAGNYIMTCKDVTAGLPSRMRM